MRHFEAAKERLTCNEVLEDILNDDEDFSGSDNTQTYPNDIIVSAVRELRVLRSRVCDFVSFEGEATCLLRNLYEGMKKRLLALKANPKFYYFVWLTYW